ncbi:MAG: integration host factor subunit alpha [Pelagibacterales bacterium MED-G40]|nr:MAG: hypothetical protein CBD63_02425 [Candidatus Pelagibacter sp. TMED203]PDH19499.1 MAG: integration host factor subunit alpha [Pelagibacterales bacterium MED-G40]|tara:strand:- start:4312 stop:4614 length:303 start_codon:yes stop_codon:yes gene_type:complete
MPKIKRENISKKQICEELNKRFGLPKLYIENFFNDTIELLIKSLKNDALIKIDNFGTFRKIKKKKRFGRNPKTKVEYEIKPRNTVSFKVSDILKKKINNV